MITVRVIMVMYRSDTISLFVIYHIPSTRVSQFCEELVSILENSIGSIRNKLLFVGDFNIHMDQPEDPNTIIFSDLLESLNLRNNITFQTTFLAIHYILLSTTIPNLL